MSPIHNVPYGLYIWLAGLLLLIVVLVYVGPWWKARRKRNAPSQDSADDLDTDGIDALHRLNP